MRNLRHRTAVTVGTEALANLAALAGRAHSRYRQGYIHVLFFLSRCSVPARHPAANSAKRANRPRPARARLCHHPGCPITAVASCSAGLRPVVKGYWAIASPRCYCWIALARAFTYCGCRPAMVAASRAASRDCGNRAGALGRYRPRSALGAPLPTPERFARPARRFHAPAGAARAAPRSSQGGGLASCPRGAHRPASAAVENRS